MDIRKVNIRKGMTKYEINKNISKWTLLEDEVYLGLYHIHTWICPKCKNPNIKPYWEFDNIENILEKELIFKLKS